MQQFTLSQLLGFVMVAAIICSLVRCIGIAALPSVTIATVVALVTSRLCKSLKGGSTFGLWVIGGSAIVTSLCAGGRYEAGITAPAAAFVGAVVGGSIWVLLGSPSSIDDSDRTSQEPTQRQEVTGDAPYREVRRCISVALLALVSGPLVAGVFYLVGLHLGFEATNSALDRIFYLKRFIAVGAVAAGLVAIPYSLVALLTYCNHLWGRRRVSLPQNSSRAHEEPHSQ